MVREMRLSSEVAMSLVRVPGSGGSRDASALICDLGRVSSYAASVPVDPNLAARFYGGAKHAATAQHNHHLTSKLFDVIPAASKSPLSPAAAQETKNPLSPTVQGTNTSSVPSLNTPSSRPLNTEGDTQVLIKRPRLVDARRSPGNVCTEGRSHVTSTQQGIPGQGTVKIVRRFIVAVRRLQPMGPSGRRGVTAIGILTPRDTARSKVPLQEVPAVTPKDQVNARIPTSTPTT